MATVKKATKKKAAKKTAASPVAKKITSVVVRLYRAGTGDCFLLQFKAGNAVKCNMMIDCGCILGSRADFEPWVADIKNKTGGTIDILVVTHEHADHINGFERCADLYDTFRFKKVWFAWTEDESDELANDLRRNHSKINFALQAINDKLQGLVNDGYYKALYEDVYDGASMLGSKEFFISSFTALNSLNVAKKTPKGLVPSMVQLFTDYKIIKEGKTEVSFLNPGDLIKNLTGLPGINVFVLGPPRDADQMDITEAEGENYEKREKKSSKDYALAAAVLASGQPAGNEIAFGPEYELSTGSEIQNLYNDGAEWRKIDYDWLYAGAGLALRYEGSINNTSLVLAFQFSDSERVLLFPGDAELGNWQSWHEGHEWELGAKGSRKKVNAGYLLRNTVFYKVGHHCSQNGSAARLGVDMMVHDDLTAMAPLSFKKIQTGWLNTMPNDLLCAKLIEKTKGRLLFSGDCEQIYPNIKTERVKIKKADEKALFAINKKFDGKLYVEYEIEG